MEVAELASTARLPWLSGRRVVPGVALLVALALSVTSCSDGSTPEASPSPATSESAEVTGLPGPFSSAEEIRPQALVSTGQQGGVLAAGEGVVVVATPNRVVAIDPRDEQVRWQVDVPGYRVAAGFGSVWATDLEGNLVRRLDVRTGAVQREIPLANGPVGILVHAGRVWVGAHRGGTVSRIDPVSDKVVSTTRVAPTGPGGPYDLAAVGDDIYVGVYKTNTLVRIDVHSAKVTRRIRFPEGLVACGALTPDGPVLWVTGCLEVDRVARVDLRTGTVTGSDAARAYLGGGVVRGRAIWFSGGSISPEAADQQGRAGLVALDRGTALVLGRLRADDIADGSVVAFGSWWVAQRDGVARFGLDDLVVHP